MPVGLQYIGDRSGGWNSYTWGLTKTNFTYENLNCGVPFPHTINNSVTYFLMYVVIYMFRDIELTVNVHIKIYKFECVEGSNTPSLTLLITNILEVTEG